MGFITPTIRICLGLFCLILVVFGHVVLFDFVTFDDPIYVELNPHVLTGLSWSNTYWAFTASRAGMWIPATWLSLQADATVFGANAWGFHLVNLLLHAVNVVIFFLLLQNMTREVWRSAVVAAIFGVHPFRVESVAWVTERKDVLSMLFLLLTVAAYYRYTLRPGLVRYALVLAMFLLANMAKPSVVTLPAALLLLDYWPLGRIRLGQRLATTAAELPSVSCWFLLAEKVPLFMLAALAAGLTLHLCGSTEGLIGTSELPIVFRLALASTSYLAYLEKTIWPTNFAALYPLDLSVWPDHWRIGLSLLALGGISAVSLRLRRSQPALIVGWLWFLGTMFPVSGVLQMGPQAMADRFTYIPHIGLIIMLVWTVDSLPAWKGLGSRLRTAIVAVGVLLLAALSWLQTWHWEDSERLYQHTLSVTPANPIISNALGKYYEQMGKFELAEYFHAQAVETDTADPECRGSYANSLIRRGEFAQALPHLAIALQNRTDDPDLHYLNAVALMGVGQQKEARKHLAAALRLWKERRGDDAARVEYLGNEGHAHSLSGDMLLLDGNPEHALKEYELALSLEPNLDHAAWRSGVALGRLGRWQEATDRFRRALDRPKTRLQASGYLAYALGKQGHTEGAKKQYTQTLHEFPHFAELFNELALGCLTKEGFLDAATAVELAEQAANATERKQPIYLDTLAAAYAGSGNFAHAIEVAEEALTLNPERVLQLQIEERLSRYRRNQGLPSDGPKAP